MPTETNQRLIADQRFRRNTFENLEMPTLGDAINHASTPGSLGFHSNLSGVNEVAGYAPVNGIGLIVVVSESKRHFEAPLQYLFINMLYTVASVGVFFVLMVV